MASLPGPDLESLIRPYVGDQITLEPASRGNSSDVTALVEGTNGRFFLKAVRNRPGGRRDSLVREGLINPHVQPICPAVLWQAENDDWITLGFETIDARPTDFTPGSPDLPAVVDILNQITGIDLPEIAKDWIETRWDRFAATVEDVELFRGDTLLYTDIHENNLLIGDNNATWAVDWAWPTRGAAFVDPACLVVQLIAAGHTAQQAESWVAQCTAWANTDPRAIDAFAAATHTMHTTRAEQFPDTGWLKAMAVAAQEWTNHRALTEE
jgi:hypothetical protein